MSRGSPAEEPISVDELTELLADATGATPEEIERGAQEIEVIHPSEADVVNE